MDGDSSHRNSGRGAKLDELKFPATRLLRHFFSGRNTMLNFSNGKERRRRRPGREEGGLLPIAGEALPTLAVPTAIL